jgi:hypothetical protein
VDGGGSRIAAGAYATCVAVAWCRYGRAAPASTLNDADPLLDRFMPVYEVRERHHIYVAAPAATTLAAAREMDLLESPLVRALIQARELVLGASPDTRSRPRGLLAEVQALGWGVLAEVSDHEIVVGAATQPWKANVVFRPIPPDEFVAFDEPDYVKIVWTLRADPVGPDESMFTTETRVMSTDPVARARFRRYWSFFSPSIILIRWVSLGPLKAEAERRARETQVELRRHASAGSHPRDWRSRSCSSGTGCFTYSASRNPSGSPSCHCWLGRSPPSWVCSGGLVRPAAAD